jgi:hypothetical protein
MLFYERFKKFPIKFYQNIKTNKVEYESGFTQGTTNTLNDAFKIFDTDEFIRDVYYFYDDVVDIRIGRFIPSLNDKIRKGRKYLGMLELELDIQKPFVDSTKTVTYLSKNKHDIPKHLEYIRQMKQPSEMPTNKFKNQLIKFVNYIKGTKMQEMFFPLKTTDQLICKHCGKIIPIGTYYESYRNHDYHIECIWDKLVNKMSENSYMEAEKFFFGLEKYVGNWPAYGFDVEEDYLSDLELVKHNNRILKRNPMTEYVKLCNMTIDYYRKLYEII